MFRNQYDTDVTVWSPQGRLHQVEYAMEAVNQGTVCLGLRSNTHVVLAGLKRLPHELASHQKKIEKIDTHLGIGMSGLTADGRSLVKYMRTEALNHKYVYGTPIQAGRLVVDLADMHQRCTQSYVRRPYGVGLLVASYDQTGPHLYTTEPSGNYFEYYAMAMGSRSQTSRTYLEKEFDNFATCSSDDLIKHALKALAASLSGDTELDSQSASIAIVGKDEPFKFVRYDEVSPQYMRAIITGVQGSPYSSGIFIFDLYLPPEYPSVPPLVKHVTPRANEIQANNGPGGFSPNLHSESGQVCLSLLGTWEGPGWDPSSSNVYQVLSSILWMILAAPHPYYLEPGFGGWEGTAPTDIDKCPDKLSVLEYDEEVKYHTALLCILAPLLQPPVGFEKVTQAHFRRKRKLIISTLSKWKRDGSSSLVARLGPVLRDTEALFSQQRTPEMVREDIDETRTAISFIERKMQFLKQKIEGAGGDELAPSLVPKAWRRFQLGPVLLAERKSLLAALEEELLSLSS